MSARRTRERRGRPPRRLPSAAALALLLAPVAALAAGKAPPPAQTIGDLKQRSVEVRPDQKVESSAARAMQNYRRYLELQTADPELRAEALRRLADLNLEAGEQERNDKEVSSLDLGGAEAIKLYSALLKAYPDYPRNDVVLYQLARAYETTGQPEKALATLDDIVKRYPTFAQLDEVEFRRGEILFSAKRYPESEKAYARSMAHNKGGFYSQSLYKHGWSLFKQGLNEESLPSFAELLDRNLIDRRDARRMRPVAKLSRADRELVEDTLRVMSITFSYLDGAKSLDAFVARRGTPPYSHLLYSRLGDLYVEKQRYQDAADAYRAFVARDPNDANAPLLAMQAIEAYRKGGFAQLVLDGKREYIERYNFASPFWQGRQRSAHPQLVAELKTNMKDVATYFHATAQKSRRVEDYQVAARWYRDYLASFPEDPESAANNFLLAQTLFESHQYADAAVEYQRTAYDYPRSDKSATAAYESLIAYQKERERLAGAEQDAWHRRQIDAGIRFAQTFPAHPDAGGVITRAAQDVFDLKDLPRSIEVAQMVLDHQPAVSAERQRIAWTIIGQASFDQGVFDKAELAFGKARELAPANDPLRKDLTQRLAASVYRQAEARREGGDGAGAVDAFLRVAELSPDPVVRATAQYDAATQLVNMKDWKRAIEVFEGYRRNWPNDTRAADVTRNLAVAYGEAGRPGDAAVEFERIAAAPNEDAAVRREALQSAADLYDKSGQPARARVVLEKFVATYPDPVAPAIEARQRLADIAAKQGEKDKQAFWQREIIRADATAGAGRTDRTKVLAARAQLALATPTRDAFRAIRLAIPLKRSLAAKRKALEAALAAYRKATDYGVAEVTTASNFEMAELYRTLGKDVMTSERPKGLSRDEREQYDTLLEEQAFPFEEQSIELHLVNAARVREGVYDEWVRRSFEALGQLKPARYGKTEAVQDVIATLDGSAPGARVQADFDRAVALVRAGKLTEAELEFSQLAAAAEGLAVPQANVGLLMRRSGDLAGAEQALQAAVARNPASAAAWTELGLTQRQRHLQDAAQSYERALAADPAYAPARRNYAVLLDVYLDDPVRALEQFERYKSMVPRTSSSTAGSPTSASGPRS
ncbi:MAG: tetratricopeptide repeat protein [Steroidobacteraceae bacterium]